jgi:hypothetical protein
MRFPNEHLRPSGLNDRTAFRPMARSDHAAVAASRSRRRCLLDLDFLPFAGSGRYDFGGNFACWRMFAMKRFRLVCLLAALAAVVSLSPTWAQVATQRYVSPTGSGTSSCTASSPCDLSRAASLVSLGDTIISCIDGGFFAGELAAATFNLTIDCPGAVLTGSVNGPVLLLSGNSSHVVILRNLTFDGANQQNAPFIKVFGGGPTLIIENCKFQNIASGNSIAIQFLPNSPAAQLIIRDSVFANNGIAPGTGGGIQVAPVTGGSASVSLERVSFNFNVTSMVISGPVNATMINSTVQASQSNGIVVGSGSTLIIEDSKLMYNVGSAVGVASGGTLRLSNDTIESNQIGIKNSGGQALTYSNNRIFGNGTTATLTPIQGGQ